MKKLSLIAVVGAMLVSNLALACQAKLESPTPRDVNLKAGGVPTTYAAQSARPTTASNQNGAGVDGNAATQSKVKTN